MPLTKKSSTTGVTAKKTSKKAAHKVATSKALRKKVTPAKAEVANKAVKRPSKAGGTTKAKANSPAKRKTASPSTSIDFAPGTDMYTAFEEVLKGGASRAEVSHRLADQWKETKTRNGNDKPVSTILNHVIRRARANGYEIQQTWQLVKVDGSEPAKVEETTVVTDETPAVKKVRRAAPAKAAKKAVKRPAKG